MYIYINSEPRNTNLYIIYIWHIDIVCCSAGPDRMYCCIPNPWSTDKITQENTQAHTRISINVYIWSITPRFKARVNGTSAVVKKLLTNYQGFFFTTAVVPFTHGLNRGVMLHMYHIHGIFTKTCIWSYSVCII